jgi:hypothetical protein
VLESELESEDRGRSGVRKGWTELDMVLFLDFRSGFGGVLQRHVFCFACVYRFVQRLTC